MPDSGSVPSLSPEMEQAIRDAIEAYQSWSMEYAPQYDRLWDAIRSALSGVRAATIEECAKDREQVQALLYLLGADVVFVGGFLKADEDPIANPDLSLCVFCSDYFCPAADAEAFTLEEAPALMALYKAGGQKALYQWVADRRGVPNVYWRHRLGGSSGTTGTETR